MSPTRCTADEPIDADSALLVHSQMNHLYVRGAGRPRDDDWVTRRVELYLRYTVPSLARQTDRQFTIWLDCRAGSEGQLQPHIDALLAAGVRVTFDRGAKLLAELPAAVRQVYVTRIDSDDLYAPDAIALIHRLHGAAAASQFYRGYVCDLTSGTVRRVALRSPPFYTLRFARDEFTCPAALTEIRERFALPTAVATA